MNLNVTTEADGTKVVEFSFTYSGSDSNAPSGWVKRAYHPVKKHFEMRDSQFDANLPRWVQTEVPLVPGRGSPTIVFMDLVAMNSLGIGQGEMRTAKICAVHDLDSALHLKWLSLRYPEKSLAILCTNTRIFLSRETSLTQSGHKIVGIGLSGGEKVRLAELKERPEGSVEELIKKYDLKVDQEFLWRFDINLKLESFY